MKLHRSVVTAFLLVFLVACAQLAVAQAGDPLPSWNEGPTKKALLDFVASATTEGSPNFVPGPERIATFDNDGTLWAEKPVYFQFFFAIDRVKELAPQHPEWATQEPFASLLAGDLEKVLAGGEKALIEIVLATHAGMSTQRFEEIVKKWIATARHPQTKRLLTNMVYQPMLELLAYLRANGFKTFIVSGGGMDFMRPWTGTVYGVPPEQVVGSSLKTEYQVGPDGPEIMRLPAVGFVDDKSGKPLGIETHIGRRPVAAFGNSDGDFQMLQWTKAGPGAPLALLVHHTDAEREYAYDKGTEAALKEAATEGWTVVDMKKDWKVIYPPEK